MQTTLNSRKQCSKNNLKYIGITNQHLLYAKNAYRLCGELKSSPAAGNLISLPKEISKNFISLKEYLLCKDVIFLRN